MNLLVLKNKQLFKQRERYVQQELANEASGHDWWHIYRVTQLAKQLQRKNKQIYFYVY